MNPVIFYKALADETRLKSLLLIAHQQELCVCELIAALDLSQPKISRHLAQLKQAGIVSDRRQGQWVFYQLSNSLVAWARRSIEQTLAENQDYLQNDLKRLIAMGDRPTRNLVCCSPSATASVIRNKTATETASNEN